MPISYHLYELQSAAPLGARSQGTVRHGALLRVRSDTDKIGYADLHPWAELGDLPLAGQLDALAHGAATGLLSAALAFAALDADARADARSLWVGLTVPNSHFLLSGLGKRSEDEMEAALAEGFTHFKIKTGKDPAAEKTSLRELASRLHGVTAADGRPPRLRLDYNETLTAAQFTAYFSELFAEPQQQDRIKPYLDFIEDPFPFDQAAWAEAGAALGATLAVDRAVSDSAAAGFGGVTVHKPARTGPFSLSGLPPPGTQRRIVTSYLDHPLGQLCAAWVAARLSVDGPDKKHEPGETHGLVSHRIYARTPFSDRLGWSGPRLHVPEGHGFGFDDELAALDWKPL